MDHSSHATDRIVVVASGFGLWLANRHVASARWGDVVEVRTAADDPSNLVVLLRDGTEIALNANVSGFQSFLAAARSRGQSR